MRRASMARRIVWVLLWGLCLVSLAVGCDCGSTIAQCSKDSDCVGSRVCKSKTGRCACKPEGCKPVACLKDFHCAPGQTCKNYQCTGNSGRCEKDADCPEGKACNVVTGICVKAGCKSDSECGSNGKSCCDLDNGKGIQCNFKRCTKNADCRKSSKNTCVEPKICTDGILSTCVQGVCKCEKPCGGGDCGTGKCCNIQQNACIENPKPCPDLKCPEGSDPPKADEFTVDPKSCKLTGPECKCKKRAPLPIGEIGTHSEIGLLNGQPVVSAYNETYGDLMVGERQTDGSFKWEFVDGLPSTGKVTGDPAGPRGGIDAPGDDVGKHTSIAVSGTTIHVAYHDATHGTLKYARKEADKWSLHTVDKQGKTIGRYISMTLENGVPVIAYFVVDNGNGKSQLRVAKGNSAQPAAEGDWKVSFVDSLTLPACKGLCDSKKKEVCVKLGSAFSCKVPGTCPKACKKGKEACVSGKCVPLVEDNANPDHPHGTGLFPSIAALQGGGVVVAYYVKQTGDLKIAYSKGGNFSTKNLKTTGNVGLYPSIAVDTSGKIHISYVNDDTADIHYLQLDAQYKVLADEVVDRGINSQGDNALADTSIVVEPGGKARIVYQDASVQAIKMAIRRGPKQWEVKSLASGEDTPYKGAFGFFADQVIQGNTSFISNYKVNLRDPKDPSGIHIIQWP